MLNDEFEELCVAHERTIRYVVARAKLTGLGRPVPIEVIRNHALVGLFLASLRYVAEAGDFKRFAHRTMFGVVMNALRSEIGHRQKGRENIGVIPTVDTEQNDVGEYRRRVRETREAEWIAEHFAEAKRLMEYLTPKQLDTVQRWMAGETLTRQASRDGIPWSTKHSCFGRATSRLANQMRA